LNSINSQLDATTFTSTTLEKLVDTTLQSKLAAQLGVTVSDQDIDQRILADKTRPEERHIWEISVTPALNTGATAPTDAQKADAKKKADAALAQIKAGTSFEDVAKSVSDDPSKSSGGDLGWIDDTATEDPAWQAALFALPVNGVTDVIEGADGVYRIGRVSEIAPAEVDAAWDQKLAAAGISQADYRTAIQSEALRAALQTKIISDDSQPGPQKHVAEIYIPEAPSTLGSKAIKVRHILYSPKHDPSNAKNVPATDPSWTQAQQQAEATYAKLQKDPSQFDAIARAESDELSDRGVDGTGGKLPFFDENSAAQGLDPAFANAILQAGLQPGQILPPFKSSFGWHVVQVMYRPPISDEMAKLKAQAASGTPFADLARDFSEGSKAGSGGDIGWVGPGQLDDSLFQAISATPVNGVSNVVDVAGDGEYLFKVLEQKTAAPDADQLKAIQSTAFTNWYTAQKDAASITRDIAPAPSASPAA
jgi:parvulin-like peptidyl-prolyl isomerase